MATEHATHDVLGALGGLFDQIAAAAAGLSTAESAVTARFLREAAAAMRPYADEA